MLRRGSPLVPFEGPQGHFRGRIWRVLVQFPLIAVSDIRPSSQMILL